MRAPAGSQVTLAVTAGDPQGVGPEVTVAAVEAVLAAEPAVRFIVCGDERQLEERWGAALPGHRAAARVAVVPCAAEASSPPPSREGGRAALAALDAACDLVRRGDAQALVTAPLSKEAVALELPGFVGHTGYLARRFGGEAVMLLAADALRVFLVTDHVPLAGVSGAVTRPRLRYVIETALAALARLAPARRPRLAVLGLNPHAGEGGALGAEETEVIAPVIAELGGADAGIEGPFPADSFFRPGRHDRFDGVVAHYHDQGLIPLKALAFGAAVNITLGLPLVRTSPDHGTAFDIAGHGTADASSMERAIVEALALLRA